MRAGAGACGRPFCLVGGATAQLDQRRELLRGRAVTQGSSEIKGPGQNPRR